MGDEYLEAYQLITQGFQVPARAYTSPEDEGASIEKCSILQETSVEYSNETIVRIWYFAKNEVPSVCWHLVVLTQKVPFEISN